MERQPSVPVLGLFVVEGMLLAIDDSNHILLIE